MRIFELQRAPWPEPAIGLDIEIPALDRAQRVVARILVVVVESHAGEEVAERQLPDLARDLNRSVEIAGRRPGERQRTFGALEAARIGRHAGLFDARIFAARRGLKSDGPRDLLADGQDRFVPILGHAAGSCREGDDYELSFGRKAEQARCAVEPVERGLARQLPVGGEHAPAIFESPDPLPDAVGLREAVAARQRAIVETVDHAVPEFVAFEPFEGDELHLARPQRKLDIAADFVFRPTLPRFGKAAAARAIEGDRQFGRLLEKEILAIFEIEIGEHAVRKFIGEARRELRIVEAAGKFRRLRFDQLPAPVGDEDIAVRSEALIAVAERHRVIELAAAARQRDFAAIELRLRIVGAKARSVAELARTAGALDDDVGDLPRQPRNIEHCAVDDFDPHHVARRDALQLVARAVGFAGQPLAIDQHVLARLAKSAGRTAFLRDHEAGNARHHVERVTRGELLEIGGLVHGAAPLTGAVRDIRTRRAVSLRPLWRRVLRERGACRAGHQEGDAPVDGSIQAVTGDGILPYCPRL